MHRRTFLLASSATLAASVTSARADYVEDVVKWMENEGYKRIEVTRTLLGRVKIVGYTDKGRRELICNPRTGEVLRDVWIDARGDVHPPIEEHSSGSGSSGQDDDDDDDDHDDGPSGHGGGDSGKSGGDGDDHDDDRSGSSGQGGGDDD